MSADRSLARVGFAVAAVLAGLATATSQGLGGSGWAAQASLRGGVSLFLLLAVVVLAASTSLFVCAVVEGGGPGSSRRLDRESATPTWE